MTTERISPERFQSLRYFVEAYLQQDWNIDGENILEIPRSRRELASIHSEIQRDAETLLSEGFSEGEPGDLFERSWKSEYEPDCNEGETWT
ncbi:hypothetical protein FOF52_06410 [Thermobifida alba]|uniref:CdiI immunity protein domain-containing protein n=1 Tax=Thermobifida alba TaxID=53522 RepID=A0ABY4KYX4_THEAE|nr:hypothetical protein [Thermobifida alba]UPT20644.1 hypothetical protein FOF52_06410 [Thermobifida alba]